MYQNTKRILSFILALILLTCTSLSAFAKNPQTDITYDLLKGDTQTFYLENEDGTISTITIEKLNANTKIATGAYKVTYDNPGIWRAGFTVQISNNKIVHAYAPFSSVTTGSISNSKLSVNSSANATYKFLYKSGITLISTGVSATMSGTSLTVSKL